MKLYDLPSEPGYARVFSKNRRPGVARSGIKADQQAIVEGIYKGIARHNRHSVQRSDKLGVESEIPVDPQLNLDIGYKPRAKEIIRTGLIVGHQKQADAFGQAYSGGHIGGTSYEYCFRHSGVGFKTKNVSMPVFFFIHKPRIGRHISLLAGPKPQPRGRAEYFPLVQPPALVHLVLQKGLIGKAVLARQVHPYMRVAVFQQIGSVLAKQPEIVQGDKSVTPAKEHRVEIAVVCIDIVLLLFDIEPESRVAQPQIGGIQIKTKTFDVDNLGVAMPVPATQTRYQKEIFSHKRPLVYLRLPRNGPDQRLITRTFRQFTQIAPGRLSKEEKSREIYHDSSFFDIGFRLHPWTKACFHSRF